MLVKNCARSSRSALIHACRLLAIITDLLMRAATTAASPRIIAVVMPGFPFAHHRRCQNLSSLGDDGARGKPATELAKSLPESGSSPLHASTSRPLRSTTNRSLLAAPRGFLVPCSHAATVVLPTLRKSANTP